ncbi:MAG TPA: biotin/lipoyl-containing protein, partial [Candidatus Elarobacter sp.]|nr:biotin/lipoyl-containing protein [Candidatus Elarobacter sp.]
MANVELKVPDLGGFSDIPVIEVLVNPGDTVKKDDPLVTLESDKATMEVPASAAGTVREIAVKVGDKVSQGSVLVRVDADEAQSATPPTPPSILPNDAVGIVASDAGSAMESGAPPPQQNREAAERTPRTVAPPEPSATAVNGRPPSPPAPAAAAAPVSANGSASG